MKSYIVFGLGRFGQAVATALYEHGNEVLAVDKDEDVVTEIQGYVTHAIIGDCADEAVIKSLGVRNFDVAIVAVGGGDIQTSTLATVLLREMGTNYIVARATDELHGRILTKVGADRVILPERDMGLKFAQSLSSSNILDMIDLSDNYSIVEVKALHAWMGKSLSELDLRSVYGITVLAVKSDGRVVITPRADYVLSENDVLVVIGHNKNIDSIRE